MKNTSGFIRRKRVVTLDDERLRREMYRLWQTVLDAGERPEALIGIATGGIFCARALEAAAAVPVLTCTMRRKSTKTKSASPMTRALPYLPYAVTDLMRQYEDIFFERRVQSAGPARIPEPSPSLSKDIAEIAEFVRGQGLKSVLVIDDAVDSGATLGCVVDALRAALTPETRVISAVVTQTRPDPLFMADFSLYHLVLCRFPWSFDFRGL